MRRKADRAEENFLSVLMGDASMDKVAVDLDPETAAALGIQTVSPSILDQLETSATEPSAPAQNASGADQQIEAPQQEEEPQQRLQPAQDASASDVNVDAFDRTDAPPVIDENEEAPPEPELPTRSSHGRLFSDKRSHPIQILETLTMRYGTHWAEWEPDTLWWALRRDFGPVGEITRDKIGALRVAATTDTPWLDWDVFEDSGLAWNDIVPIIGAFQPMTPMQAAFAVHVLHGIRPDESFNNEVKAYIAAILDQDGWAFAPEEYFDGAQELLDRKVWLVGFKQQVMDAWEKLKDVDPTTIEWNYNNPLDVHILKLMTVRHYVAERDAIREKVPGASTSSSTVQPPVP